MSYEKWLRNRENGLSSRFPMSADIFNIFGRSKQVSVLTTKTESSGVNHISFSHNSNLMIVACNNKLISLYDTINRNQVLRMPNAHGDCVNCVRFFDEKTFASSSHDGTLRIWDIRNINTSLRTLVGHDSPVKNIKYIKKANLLLSCGQDGRLFRWNLNAPSQSEHEHRIFYTTGSEMNYTISSDETKLAIADGNGFIVILHNLDLLKYSTNLLGFYPKFFGVKYPVRLDIRHIRDENAIKEDIVNRIEFVTDFPHGNLTNHLTDLHIHPQGSCLLSRNLSYNNNFFFNPKIEYLSVHDIQECWKNTKKSPLDRNRYKRNPSKLIYYNKQPVERIFHQKSCFSSNGHIICSPYGQYLRIYSYAADYRPFKSNPQLEVQGLYEIRKIDTKNDISKIVKFVPNSHVIVSGTLNGNINWYHPVL